MLYGFGLHDVRNLTPEDIVVMDDKEWVMSKRKKTNIAFNVLLLDLPKAIISKYNHDTYRDGKLFPILSKPRLACLNFFNALECIPKVIESHDKEIAKVSANKEVYTAIANSSWKRRICVPSKPKQPNWIERLPLHSHRQRKRKKKRLLKKRYKKAEIIKRLFKAQKTLSII